VHRAPASSVGSRTKSPETRPRSSAPAPSAPPAGRSCPPAPGCRAVECVHRLSGCAPAVPAAGDGCHGVRGPSGRSGARRDARRIRPKLPRPSIDSTGVTHVFADFFGTMPASDSSTTFKDFGSSPSRDCPSSTTDVRASPRSPGSRAEGLCELAELLDPGGLRCSTPALVGAPSWPSASDDGVGDVGNVVSEARSPGPLIRLPMLRRTGHPALRKAWLPGGGLLPGRTCVFRRCLFLMLTCFLLPVCAGAPSRHLGVRRCATRAYSHQARPGDSASRPRLRPGDVSCRGDRERGDREVPPVTPQRP